MATHTVRVWQETGANGRRGLLEGFYAGTMHAGRWHASEAHASEIEAVHAVLGQLKAKGISGSARVERAADDKQGARLNSCKPKWQDKRKRDSTRERFNHV
jgi:hypothetical protein